MGQVKVSKTTIVIPALGVLALGFLLWFSPQLRARYGDPGAQVEPDRPRVSEEVSRTEDKTAAQGPGAADSGPQSVEGEAAHLRKQYVEKSIKSSPRFDVAYTDIIRDFAPSDLPYLRSMLEDPAYEEVWDQISRMIAYLGRDSSSSTAIIDYLRRPDGIPSLPEESKFWKARGKWEGFQYLGITQTPEAIEYLRQIFINVDPSPLVGQWAELDYPTGFGGSYDVKNLVRGGASVGLVLSRDSSAIQLVYDQYRILDAEAEQTNALPMLYKLLSQAVAIDMFIKDNSREEYLRLMGGPPRAEEGAYFAYLDKTYWPLRQGP